MYYDHIVPVNLRFFLNNPSKEGFTDLLLNNTGETDFLDFKTKWVEFTKLAKHILAIANSGGGCMLIGVKQLDDGTSEFCGLSDEEFLDKADVDNKLDSLLPKYLKYRTEDYYFTTNETTHFHNKLFQVLIIEYDPKYVPYTSVVTRGELRYGAIYIRQGTKSLEATNDKLVEMILRKVQSGGSDSNDLTLQEHLEQLKSLYHEEVSHQKETYQHYIQDLIEKKKARIEAYLDVLDIKKESED
ncbi:AlbA family DNA-binding domain-containing protein [Bacillus sp. 2205SS5-2]|uniref:AlbA family DNA-binding domain-containing protein n=1 Tax=Bacillus sp. 2205SS5-2 TaxID=3109031 RepID=UPI003004E7DF